MAGFTDCINYCFLGCPTTEKYSVPYTEEVLSQRLIFVSEFIGNMLAINIFIANVKRNATIPNFYA